MKDRERVGRDRKLKYKGAYSPNPDSQFSPQEESGQMDGLVSKFRIGEN